MIEEEIIIDRYRIIDKIGEISQGINLLVADTKLNDKK